jgi:hypothetical protein
VVLMKLRVKEVHVVICKRKLWEDAVGREFMCRLVDVMIMCTSTSYTKHDETYSYSFETRKQYWSPRLGLICLGDVQIVIFISAGTNLAHCFN